MKKIVITGGPCVGKTTTISLIKEHGIHVIDEVPRDIIAAELGKQKNNPSYEPIVPWTKFEEFQHLIIDEQLKRESEIPENTRIVLLDRSLVDLLGYCKVANKQPPEQLMAHIKNAGYTKVVFLDQLPNYETDAERKEDAEFAKKIHEEILTAYKQLGFEIIIVPPHDKETRARIAKGHIIA